MSMRPRPAGVELEVFDDLVGVGKVPPRQRRGDPGQDAQFDLAVTPAAIVEPVLKFLHEIDHDPVRPGAEALDLQPSLEAPAPLDSILARLASARASRSEFGWLLTSWA